MKAEVYDLHIYCDARESKECWTARPLGGASMYTGRNRRETLKQARQSGWKAPAKHGETDICPACRKAMEVSDDS